MPALRAVKRKTARVFRRATPTTRLGGVAATPEEAGEISGTGRDGSNPTTHRTEKKKTASRGRATTSVRRLCCNSYCFTPVFVKCPISENIAIVHALLEVMHFYPSSVVNQLIRAGITPIATELARKNLPLAGRLQHFVRNWEKISQDQSVLDAVRGFAIPFISQPHQPCPPMPLHHSSEEEKLLQEEIRSMLAKQAIEKTTPRGRGFLSMVFLVPKKDGGQRPVINLKSLNNFVHTQHFKMEGIHVLLRAGDWMDAYFMLPIREEENPSSDSSLVVNSFLTQGLTLATVLKPLQ